MALPDAVQGATRPTPQLTWTDEAGEPLVLTGATLTGTITNQNGTVRAIVGDLTVIDATNGVFSWAYDAADVAAAGLFMVQFTAGYGSPPSPARSVRASWLVHPTDTVS